MTPDYMYTVPVDVEAILLTRNLGIVTNLPPVATSARRLLCFLAKLVIPGRFLARLH